MLTIERTTLTAQAVEKIKEYIVSNGLSKGDRLPTEREFGRMMGVGASAVREAVKSLEALGLVKSRVGDGMYVGGLDYSKLAEHFYFVIAQNGAELQHLAEARQAIELGAIEYVIPKVDDDAISRLQETIDRMRVARTMEEHVSADSDFHERMIEITGNPILMEFRSLIHEFFAAIAANSPDERRHGVVEEHAAILEALRNRDLERARQIIRNQMFTTFRPDAS